MGYAIGSGVATFPATVQAKSDQSDFCGFPKSLTLRFFPPLESLPPVTLVTLSLLVCKPLILCGVGF
jgi:hypothetical protein